MNKKELFGFLTVILLMAGLFTQQDTEQWKILHFLA